MPKTQKKKNLNAFFYKEKSQLNNYSLFFGKNYKNKKEKKKLAYYLALMTQLIIENAT